jgi:hypothetical protein
MPLLLKNARFSASALLLLSLGGTWLWTRTSQKEEISGKDVQAASYPEKKAAPLLKPGGAPFQPAATAVKPEATLVQEAVQAKQPESRATRAARLQAEARALLDAEPLKRVRDNLDCYFSGDIKEELRQASRSPECRRWRELVKEIIEAGPVSSENPLHHRYQIDPISLLVHLSRLDGDEADPEALQDALKLNRVLPAHGASQRLTTAFCENLIQEELASTLLQQSSEALCDFADLLRENSDIASRDALTMLQDEHKDGLEKFLSDPFMYRNRELRNLLGNPARVQELRHLIQRLDSQLRETWEQSSDWSQRLQAQQDFDESLFQQLDSSLSEHNRKALQEMFATDVLKFFSEGQGHRQALRAALQVEQFRREQGRLPLSLEEAGWNTAAEQTALSYEIKDGKARLTTPEPKTEGSELTLGLDRLYKTPSPLEVAW